MERCNVALSTAITAPSEPGFVGEVPPLESDAAEAEADCHIAWHVTANKDKPKSKGTLIEGSSSKSGVR